LCVRWCCSKRTSHAYMGTYISIIFTTGRYIILYTRIINILFTWVVPRCSAAVRHANLSTRCSRDFIIIILSHRGIDTVSFKRGNGIKRVKLPKKNYLNKFISALICALLYLCITYFFIVYIRPVFYRYSRKSVYDIITRTTHYYIIYGILYVM